MVIGPFYWIPALSLPLNAYRQTFIQHLQYATSAGQSASAASVVAKHAGTDKEKVSWKCFTGNATSLPPPECTNTAVIRQLYNLKLNKKNCIITSLGYLDFHHGEREINKQDGDDVFCCPEVDSADRSLMKLGEKSRGADLSASGENVR